MTTLNIKGGIRWDIICGSCWKYVCIKYENCSTIRHGCGAVRLFIIKYRLKIIIAKKHLSFF